MIMIIIDYIKWHLFQPVKSYATYSTLVGSVALASYGSVSVYAYSVGCFWNSIFALITAFTSSFTDGYFPHNYILNVIDRFWATFIGLFVVSGYLQNTILHGHIVLRTIFLVSAGFIYHDSNASASYPEWFIKHNIWHVFSACTWAYILTY